MNIFFSPAQVSQAILLDQFVAVASNTIAEEEAERRRIRRSEELIHNTLDPLMEKLTKDYIDDVDLSHRLQDLFKVGRVVLGTRSAGSLVGGSDRKCSRLWQVLDTDDSKGISFTELCLEMRKLVRMIRGTVGRLSSMIVLPPPSHPLFFSLLFQAHCPSLFTMTTVVSLVSHQNNPQSFLAR